MRLYHYTCSHAAPLIEKGRWLTPAPQVQFLLPKAPNLVWLTDLDQPDVLGLGLTSYSLRCDRTEYQATASADASAEPWTTFARKLSRRARLIVEDCPGVLPMHWWVSELPVPIFDIVKRS